MNFGDGESRYATRGMDGSQFKRDNTSLRFEKTNIGEHLQEFEASIYHNVADHVMDNYTLRTPNPHSMMPMPMANTRRRPKRSPSARRPRPFGCRARPAGRRAPR